MSSSWKIPKIKKKLRNFLTDESGKITKKDALWLSAAALYIAGIENVSAAHTNTVTVTACGHINQAAVDLYNSSWAINETLTAHSSGIINGTYNDTPNGWHLSAVNTTGTTNTNQVLINEQEACSSHTNSHSSGGWC